MNRLAKVASLYTFEIAFAFVLAVIGVSWLVAGHDLAIHSAIESDVRAFWHYVWGALYLGGLVALYGIWRKDARFRVAGLSMTVAALLMNGVAAVSHGVQLRDATFFIWAAAGLARCVDLARQHK